MIKLAISEIFHHKNKMKKIAFFGTPNFTIDFLNKLKESGFSPSLIITNPDRPYGRGMQISSPLPKKWAEENNIKCLQPEKLGDDFYQEVTKEDWDLFVVIAYGKIIPERIINTPKYGTINIHYSLLPKYRGATPVESAILNGDKVTGASIQQMVFKLDAGDVIAQKEIPINENDTTPMLREKINKEALELLPQTIQNIFNHNIIPIPQDETLATHSGKIKKEDGEIFLNDEDVLNWRKYKAYYGSVGTFFFSEKDGKKIRNKITKARFENGKFTIEEIIPENGKRQVYK